MTNFRLSKAGHGHGTLGLYGSRTCLETPGPGRYDPYPFLNPACHRTSNPRHLPDRSPGFLNVVDRGPTKWKPEPFSLSRLQCEQPLVHYSSATFFDWPEQRRRNAAAAAATSYETSNRARRIANSYSSGDFDNTGGTQNATQLGLPSIGRTASEPFLGEWRSV
mmetsp:Transcript_77424/g.165963  ORF Transcript_77424/g.165963 Transcript_77424/m.165963 type:complete len:164 (-) Transcript_77424:149-640(-)